MRTTALAGAMPSPIPQQQEKSREWTRPVLLVEICWRSDASRKSCTGSWDLWLNSCVRGRRKPVIKKGTLQIYPEASGSNVWTGVVISNGPARENVWIGRVKSVSFHVAHRVELLLWRSPKGLWWNNTSHKQRLPKDFCGSDQLVICELFGSPCTTYNI
jgi:hypothetical protein